MARSKKPTGTMGISTLKPARTPTAAEIKKLWKGLAINESKTKPEKRVTRQSTRKKPRTKVSSPKEKFVPLFPKFGQLPVSTRLPDGPSSKTNDFSSQSEVRLIIWGFLELKPYCLTAAPSSTHIDLANYIRPVPTVLKICREARHEFLHREGEQKSHPTYRLCSRLTPLNSRNKVYISFAIDTVVAMPGTFQCADLRGLQNLGFAHSHPWNYLLKWLWCPLTRSWHYRMACKKRLRHFAHLQTITFFTDRPVENGLKRWDQVERPGDYAYGWRRWPQDLAWSLEELDREDAEWRRPEIYFCSDRILNVHPKKRFAEIRY